ncbi:hypothetical protein EJG51_004155 [Undibacterium piscinae]|uniref:Uncharacterized protein n=1 Tax=Undibacterium piscinae TaxID=2495591 RepID=A0A6M4A1L9_9BURK|nr:hypothetical protein EJG51_004155 [Undibacterium piscinae]
MSDDLNSIDGIISAPVFAGTAGMDRYTSGNLPKTSDLKCLLLMLDCRNCLPLC